MKVRLLVLVPRGATLRSGDAHEDDGGAAKEVRDPGMAAIGTDENNGQKSGQKSGRKPARPRTMATWRQSRERAIRVLLVVMFSSTASRKSMRAEAGNRLMAAWMRGL
ncbi:hypothetical protein [Paraburkholderia sp. J8-2]|uniref:hypothetical protein n=1 Tax=Paraburkholderia sp. J8-2 TaxID=2805440 RepID=UPI002AB763E5|nr:hypothetical protein [Paraburkholderia sp. J8-2]